MSIPRIGPVSRSYILPIALVLAITAAILLAMGRVPICECGYVKLWEGDNWSPGNSQHLSDWYTASHIIHGFAFYYLARLITRVVKLPTWAQITLALLIESAWEILENSPIIIDRYRTTTSSVDYYGDSVINSLSDIAAMAGGYILASRVRWQYVILLTLAFEALTIYLIRDGLLFNIIMLIYPLKALKEWQLQISP